ncbi:hypothetical protein ASE92_20110 [Pedobacter sp. Leaf41]|uniref:hypothetical protein n=1 Tax=Pedobacter sp. Leaf41 TaxID=1736218 RepID=UPI0007039473|nr:hypothetical protein [Pedobacter sp. Leaf41]KQN37243.1 hypothetical protein ASE92_20110 [Pedobacter sp. Leaf41]
MKIEYIEYVLIAIVIIVQLWFFIRTRNKITEFKNSIPNISQVEITETELTDEQIEAYVSNKLMGEIESSKHSDILINEVENVDYDEQLELYSPQNYNEGVIKTNRIKIVSSLKNESKTFKNILSSLNKYLVRNRHSSADFNLVKDIVERNTDTIEEEINLTLSTPLYLGLMGTMIGIVIGLYSMSDIFNSDISDESLSKGIGILLGGVKIAMVASFVGLLLTIINSSFSFKGTKYNIEIKKNDFYTFIQVVLLPSLNQGIGSTFESLQRNLSKFNEKFDSNLDRLSTVFDKNYESIKLQKMLVEQMDKTKVAEMTKYNVQVLKELNVAIEQFDKFNVMFNNINIYIANSYRLAETSTELLDKTNNFEKIANTIQENLNSHHQLMEFLTSHFSDLKLHKTKVDEAVVGISFSIKDTFDQLQKSMILNSQNLGEEAVKRNLDSQNIFNAFTNELKESFLNQTEIFKSILDEKKSNLDQLQHLQAILSELKSNKNINPNDKLTFLITDLNKAVSSSNEIMERIESNIQKPFYAKLFPKKQLNERQ